MIHRVTLTNTACDLPQVSMGDYVIATIPEAGTTVTIRLGESLFNGCDGCPIHKLRVGNTVIINCRNTTGGIICAGGDFYPAEITDMLEDI